MPLSDYPNHVARMHIIAQLAQSADLAKDYSVKWEFIPNLAMDILAPLLIRNMLRAANTSDAPSADNAGIISGASMSIARLGMNSQLTE